jgi:hypothetical protein
VLVIAKAAEDNAYSNDRAEEQLAHLAVDNMAMELEVAKRRKV